MLGSKFVKFLMSILNWQVNYCSNLVSFFIVITRNSPVNFKFIHFLLWIKGPHQSSNFLTSEHESFRLPNMLWWKLAKLLMLFSKLQVSFSSNFVSLTPLDFFRSNITGKAQSANFWDFQCSDQNSPNSCYFWHIKNQIFLLILSHQS